MNCCIAIAGLALATPTVAPARAGSGTVLHRRALLGAAASALVLSPRPTLAADGSWTQHSGPFTAEFFQDGFKSTDSGFLYKFVQPGEGEKPVNMQQVFVHYKGYLLDGQQFDSSYNRDPFKFRLGKGKVIAGWEAVVAGMRPGQKVIVKIPPEFAYGAQAVGPIPANAPLVRVPTPLHLGEGWGCARGVRLWTAHHRA
jgi:hypothetical protein